MPGAAVAPYTQSSVIALSSYQPLLDDLERTLSPARFLHVLGVTHTAVQLATRHGLDPGLAALAGLVHDRSKALSPQAIEADLASRGIAIPEDDRPFPAIWHGLHAAVWLRQDSGWADGEELEALAEAVQHHSTSEAGLGPLGRLLFIADYTEPGRMFEGLDALRRLAMEDLESGYKSCLATKCRYMVERQRRTIHPRAQRALKNCGIDFEGWTGADSPS